jgi:hypothetical protein
MTKKRPLVAGPVSGNRMLLAKELPIGDELELGSEQLDSDLQRKDARIGAQSPRGILPLNDLGNARLLLAQCSGLWTCGTAVAASETNPERLSVFYRTRIDGTYATRTGTPIAVNDIVTGSTGAWTARVVATTHTGPNGTFQLSLFSGTAAGAGAETLTGPAGTWTGCALLGTGVGQTTGYADVSGAKAPRYLASGGSGYYNCVGVQQEIVLGPSRFPRSPENYQQSFKIPRGLFGQGAMIEVVMTGVVLNTTPDNPLLYVTLAMADNLFESAGIHLANNRARMRFVSPAFPTISAEEPFVMTVRLSASRKTDRTEGNIGLLLMEMSSAVYGGSGAFRASLQRGSDRVVTPATFPGFDHEKGDDLVTKRSLRNVGVWIAAGPEFATSGDFHVNVHTMQAFLSGGIR